MARSLAVALVLVVSGSGLAACSDGGGAASTTTTAAPAAPEVIISAAVDRVGPWRTRLGSVAANRRLLTLVFALRGSPRPEVECYADRAIPAFGQDRFGDLTVHAIQRWASVTVLDVPLDARRDAAACVTEESAARQKAKELAPDLDLPETRALLRDLAARQSVAIGMTSKEAECYAAASYDDLTDDQIRAGLANQLDRSVRDPEGGIRDCMTAARRKELSPKVAAAMAAQKQLEDAEHDLAESKINAEIQAGASGSTTTTTTG